VAFAQSFEKAGAKYLHLVDLDGAKAGKLHYFGIAKKIVENTNLFVEASTPITILLPYFFSIAWVNSGSFCAIVPSITRSTPADKQCSMVSSSRIPPPTSTNVIGVDAKDEKVAVEGWLEKTETDAFEFCQQLVEWGAETIIFTEISRYSDFPTIALEIPNCFKPSISFSDATPPEATISIFN
jgi:phosphoribosylformimino-5-aminoimidazole carboxamide ribotide isomerase